MAPKKGKRRKFHVLQNRFFWKASPELWKYLDEGRGHGVDKALSFAVLHANNVVGVTLHKQLVVK